MSGNNLQRDYDDTMSMLNTVVAKKRAQNEALRQVANLASSAHWPDGSVTVKVNGDGVLTGLHLSDAVAGLPPQQITHRILQTYGLAQQEAAEQASAALAPIDGVDYLADRVESRKDYTPEPLHVAPPPHAPSSHHEEPTAQEPQRPAPPNYDADEFGDTTGMWRSE